MKRNTLTRSEVSARLHTQFGLSRQECGELVDMMLDMMCESLVNDGAVKVRHFGSFHTKDKGARIGRNPKTGESIVIKPRKVVTFRASSVLRKRVNASASF